MKVDIVINADGIRELVIDGEGNTVGLCDKPGRGYVKGPLVFSKKDSIMGDAKMEETKVWLTIGDGICGFVDSIHVTNNCAVNEDSHEGQILKSLLNIPGQPLPELHKDSEEEPGK